MDEWCCVGVCDGRGWGGGGSDARVTHLSPANPTLAVSECFVEVCISRSIWLVTARVSHFRISEHFVLWVQSRVKLYISTVAARNRYFKVLEGYCCLLIKISGS